MGLLILVVAGLAAPLAEAQLPAAEARRREIDVYVESQMKLYGITGLSVAVVRDGRPVHIAGYGLSNVELKVPATPATIYPLSSATKIFSGTAAMLLVQDGLLNLEESVRSYLSETPEAWDSVSVRNLLTHLSGLPDVLECEEPTFAKTLDCVAKLPIIAGPGETFRYNQTNYFLLKAVIEELAEESLESLVEKRLLAPAKMDSTTYAGSVFDVVEGRATSYYPDGSGGIRLRDFQFPEFHFAGAGLNSSVEDLVKWDAALFGGKILLPETLKEMWQEPERTDGRVSSYAMGWDLRTHAPGHRSAGHEGGGLATFRRFIEDDLTVIVLSNGTANRFNPDQIAEGIAGLVVPEIRSAAAHLTDRMKLAIIDQGIEEALRLYRDFIADRLPGDEPTEREMNSLGYDLLHLGRPEQAIEILKSNIERYPESSNAHDSLGEAFLEAGNRDRARTHYRRSLDLDSSNDNAIRVLETLAGYVLPYPAGERFLLLQGNNGPWGHTGAAAYAFDFKMTIGTPVTAARGGQVVALEKSFKDGNRIPGQENFVVVRHGDGTYGRYYHLTSNGVQVSVGQEVLQGAEIGWSGDTGASAGPHLHFDVTTDCFEWGCQTIEIAFGKTDTPKLTQGQSYEAQ